MQTLILGRIVKVFLFPAKVCYPVSQLDKILCLQLRENKFCPVEYIEGERKSIIWA